MDKKLTLNISTPNENIDFGDIDMITLPGIEGEMTILPDHTSIISMLQSGVILIYKPEYIIDRLFIPGGFFENKFNKCSIISSEIIYIKNLSVQILDERISKINDSILLYDDVIRTNNLLNEISILNQIKNLNLNKN